MRSRHAFLPVALVLAVAVATACGGSASGTHAAAPSNGAASRPVISAADRAKIQQCLTAAGISVPQAPGGGTRLSGSPRPGFTPGTNGAGGGGLFQSPQVQQALKACGIALPQRSATPPPS